MLLQTASAPTLDGKYCGKKTPSGEQGIITVSASRRFRACSYGARTAAIDVSFSVMCRVTPRSLLGRGYLLNMRDEHIKPFRAENDACALIDRASSYMRSRIAVEGGTIPFIRM